MPFTSHPKCYIHKNAQKFISLRQIGNDLKANIFLMNYAKKGTEFEDQVLLMKVKEFDANQEPPVRTMNKQLRRAEFSGWLRQLNQRGVR